MFTMFLLVWLPLSIVAGAMANKKGRSFAGFLLLSLFLSPIVGIIAAFVANENKENIEKTKFDSGTSKKCPFCAEIIKTEAIICRFCGKDLPQKISEQVKEDSSQDEKIEKSEEPLFNVLFYLILFIIGTIIVVNIWK